MSDNDHDVIVSGCSFEGGTPVTTAIRQSTIGGTGRLIEYGNRFVGSTLRAYDINTPANQSVALYSRRGHNATITSNSSTITLDGSSFPSTCDFGTIQINRTDTTAPTLNAAGDVPIGDTLLLSVYRNGGGGSVTLTFGSNFSVDGTYALADNAVTSFLFFGMNNDGNPQRSLVGTPISDIPE
jgi:hypothetical protein